MREEIRSFLKRVLDNYDTSCTWYYDLETHNGKRWALVAAWMDYEDEGEYKPYCKLAYQPTNSMMQCDYDVDWMMPTDKDGDVDTTELCFGTANGEPNSYDIDWILKEWESYKELYVHPKGTNILFAPDPGGFADQTQFDTTDRKELAELWFDFCLENKLIELEEVEIYE